MSGRNAIIENASNGQTPFLERRLLVGLIIPRPAIYYGLFKLECCSWNVADWTRVIPCLRSVNGIKMPFINAKRLSGVHTQRYCGARGKNAVHCFSTVQRYNGNGIFSMTPTQGFPKVKKMCSHYGYRISSKN